MAFLKKTSHNDAKPYTSNQHFVQILQSLASVSRVDNLLFYIHHLEAYIGNQNHHILFKYLKLIPAQVLANKLKSRIKFKFLILYCI